MIKMSFERFKANGPGYREVLRSGEVEADLQGRADRVKAEVVRAHPGLRIKADTTRGRNRVGATVIGVPLRIEKRRRLLGRAIDAAR